MCGNKPNPNKTESGQLSVFMPTSTYQLILSSSIAARKRGPNILITQPTFEKKRVISSLVSTKSCPFDRDIILPDARNKRLRNTYNVLRAYVFCFLHDVGELYTTHATPAAQVLLHSTAGDCVHLEDGTAAYCPLDPTSDQTRLKCYLSKLVYGPRWNGWYKQGEHPEYDKIAATFPAYIYERGSELKRERIISDSLSPLLREWATKYFEQVGNLDKIQGIDTLFLLPHSGSPEAKKTVRVLSELLEQRYERGRKIGVKYHPRENQEYLDGSFDYVKVPKDVPAEFLYTDNVNLTSILGGLSTSLLSAKWIRPEIHVQYYHNSSNSRYDNVLSLFSDLGMESIDGG